MNEQPTAWPGSKQEPSLPFLIAVPEAARLLGIGETLARELIHLGQIPSVNLGRRVLVPRAALERLAQVHPPTDSPEVEAEPEQRYGLAVPGGNDARFRTWVP